MAIDKKKLQKKLESFETACHAAGLKVTHQRWEVYSELASSKEHPTAEMLYRKLQRKMPTLSLDTVYRTLTTLEEHDLITRVQTTESHARFEAEMEEHHHVICSQCGKITDFHWDICDRGELPRNITSWGQIKNKQITLRGICAECAKGKKTAA